MTTPAVGTPRLQGRIALVAGASGTIGAAVAMRLAADGALVVAVARREERLQALAAAIAADGGRCLPLVGDLTEMEQIGKLAVAAAEAAGGPVTVLANCVGREQLLPALMAAPREVEGLLTTNFRGTVELTRRLARPMLQAEGGGAIVNVASVTGLVGTPGAAVYSATKAALLAWTRSVALEWAPAVRVNAVSPGCIHSDMLDRMFARVGGAESEHIEAAHPLGLGTPEDVANAVAFLCSPEAQWITGANLVVDGGYSAR